MDDLISRQSAIDVLGEKPLVWDDLSDFELGKAAQWADDVEAIKNVSSAQTSRIEKILHGKSPKEQFEIIERIFATGRYWTDSRQAISDWFDGKEMPLFDYYIGRHD